jgi:TolB-like protein
MRFWALVTGWAFRSAWIFFKRWPKWLRVFVYVWVGIAVVAKGCTPHEHQADTPDPDVRKLAQIANSYHGSLNKDDVAKLGKQIAQTFSDEADGDAPTESSVLAIPFGAPAGDPTAQNVADASFAQMYGKVAIAHHGQVALADGPLAALSPAAAAEQGRAHQAKFVIYGGVDSKATPANLVLKIVRVSDAAVVWSDARPVASVDAAKIAAEVSSKLQSLEDD